MGPNAKEDIASCKGKSHGVHVIVKFVFETCVICGTSEKFS